jgi:hypothetical protein
MREGLEIKGGATEFEAAVIAIVLDEVERMEKAARTGRVDRGAAIPAWVRAMAQERPGEPRQVVAPD